MKLAKMDRKLFLQIIKIVGTILAISLFIYFVYKNWTELVKNIQLFGVKHLILLLFLTLLSRILVCFRWYFLLKPLEPNISILNVIKISFTGLFATNFLPTTIGGDIVRLTGGLRFGYNPINLTSSLLLDRTIGMIGMIIALPINIDNPNLSKLSSYKNLIQIQSAMFGFSTVQKVKEYFSKIVSKLIEVINLWKNHPKAILLSFLSTVGHMICLFITIWGLFLLQNERIPLSIVAGLWSLSYFFTLLPLSINGLGLQEVSIAYLYSTIGGASLESCLVVAIMIRILQSLASLPGALFLPSVMIKNAKNE